MRVNRYLIGTGHGDIYSTIFPSEKTRKGRHGHRVKRKSLFKNTANNIIPFYFYN